MNHAHRGRLNETRARAMAGALVLGSLGVFACTKHEDPIAPTALAATAATSAQGVFLSMSKGVTYLDSDQTFLRKVSRSVSNPPLVMKASQSVTMAMVNTVPALRPLFGHPEKKQTLAGQLAFATVDDSSGGLHQSFDDAANDIAVLLRDRVLVDANLESKTDDTATYKLNPTPTCLPLPSDMAADVTVPDPECVDDLMKLEVRVVLSRDGDGVRLSVQIGTERKELFAFIVHSADIALEIDLPQAKAAIDIADTALNKKVEGNDPVKMLAGKVRLAISKDGDQKFTGSIGLLAALDVETTDDNGVSNAVFKSEAHDPLFAITVDGVAQSLTATSALGATEVDAPWDPKNTGAVNTDLHVVLGGLNGSTTVSDGDQKLSVTGFGFGAAPTHIDVRGQTIFQLDLNPMDARKLDFVVTLDPTGQPIVSVTPKIDMSLGFHFNAIASDYDAMNQPPMELLDQTYRLLLAGATPVSFQSVAANATTGAKGGVKIVAGLLTLSSDKSTTQVMVPAGQCLVTQDAPMGSDPVLGSLTSAACPQ